MDEPTFSNSMLRLRSASVGPAIEIGFVNLSLLACSCCGGGGRGGVEPPIGLSETTIFELLSLESDCSKRVFGELGFGGSQGSVWKQ